MSVQYCRCSLCSYSRQLTTRQAADAVRSRIDWKYALALELTDSGFDASVLSEFRTRLLDGNLEHLLLETLLSQLQESNLHPSRGRQRTDSTHVLAAIRTLNRLELVAYTLHFALNRLAVVAPDWVRLHSQPVWFERYAVRAENSRLPKADSERRAFASQVGADGFALLQAVYSPETPVEVRGETAVDVLRLVWLQQYYGPEDEPRMRNTADAPPSERLIHSPYDLEARYSIKRGMSWTGYKVQITETCDTTAPHIITHVETTPATRPDDHMLDVIHEALKRPQLLPAEHFVDCGYTDATTLIDHPKHYGVTIVGRVAADPSWQAREQTGYDQSAFQVNWDTRKATCPQGKQSRKWFEDVDVNGQEVVQIRFAQKECNQCLVRALCTRAKTQPRTITIRTQPYYDALQTARRQQQTTEFQANYAVRAGVEATMSQGVRAFDLRRSRYIGLAKTRLQHVLIAVAINLVRVLAWLADPVPPKPRVGAFAALLTQVS